jgi:hypothetical protein
MPDTPQEVELAAEQHGSRWFHAPPAGEDFAAWFAANVKIHEGMEHAPYVTGCVMIGSQETYKRTIQKANGELVFLDSKRRVYTPYAKVETRVAYFWDLMDTDGFDDVVGMIEPVPMASLNDPGYVNYNLPPGFFRIPIGLGGNIVSYIGCSMKVSMWDKGSIMWVEREEVTRLPDGTETTRPFHELQGTPVRVFPSATKMVPVLSRSDEEDPFAVMKAETGAVGRALGMAGMLVIPGSGVATADDMLEVDSITRGVTSDPSLPAAPQAAAEGVDEVEELKVRFEALDKGQQTIVEEWAEGRKIDLSNPKSTQLRAIRAQIDRLS